MRLHGYFRSSAAWRVRIALGLKGLVAEQSFHHLRKGEQNAPAYKALNPQGLLPALETDEGDVLTQSIAIIEWLDETHPHPALLPTDPIARAKVRAFAQVIACDTHPLQNLKVLNRVRALAGGDEGRVTAWAAGVIVDGFTACEALLQDVPGPFAFGTSPTLADICLVPQVFNAQRLDVDLAPYPRIRAIHEACMQHQAFADAQPSRQPDAEK